MQECKVGEFVFQVLIDDIAQVSADAIVCPANSHGHMRGGASQALRLRGGDVIETEARRYAPIRLGTAVATTAGDLSARWVIHAPTMRDPVEISSPQRIRRAAAAATGLAARLGAESIAFPALGAGVGEVGPGRAASALLEGVIECEARRGILRLVKLVARTQAMEVAFSGALKEVLDS